MADPMKAISIRQPWAWLILNGGKDIENRTWPTTVRGRVLIHAGKGMTRKEHDDGAEFYWKLTHRLLPHFAMIDRGGVVGSVEIIDCVTTSESPWFFGPYGFKLARPQILPFQPLNGRLGFFDIPTEKQR